MIYFKEIYQQILSFFTYSYSEKKGILTLLFLYISYLGISHFYSNNESERVVYDHSEFKKEVQAFLISQNRTERNRTTYTSENTKALDSKLFNFNPNIISVDSLLLLGFSDYAARNVHKYRSKGGRFDTNSDLKKIYGLDDKLFIRISPFIQIPKRHDSSDLKNESFNNSERMSAKVSIDLNMANKEELMSIRGIGPVFADRIITYRNRLGGYIKKEQLMEVYGINDTIFIQIEGSVLVSDTIFHKLNVNELDAKGLITHPYFDNWNVVNAITKFRGQHGPFNKVTDLKKIHLFDTALYNKVAPYLTTK